MPARVKYAPINSNVYSKFHLYAGNSRQAFATLKNKVKMQKIETIRRQDNFGLND